MLLRKTDDFECWIQYRIRKIALSTATVKDLKINEVGGAKNNCLFTDDTIEWINETAGLEIINRTEENIWMLFKRGHNYMGKIFQYF